MSTSTDGQICYGIYFWEGYDFPWDAKYYDYDIDEWWRTVNSYSNPFPNPYDEHSHYFKYWEEWLKSHPLPVKLVNYQSDNVPAYILAVPSSVRIAHRGYPEGFLPSELKIESSEIQALLDFCNQYGLTHDTPPAWYLSSYWG